MENFIFFVQCMLYFRTYYKTARIQYLRLIVEKKLQNHQNSDLVMGILLSFWVDQIWLSEVMKLQSYLIFFQISKHWKDNFY